MNLNSIFKQVAPLLTLFLFLLLPLGGIWLSSLPLSPYLAFPPRTVYVTPPEQNNFIFGVGLFALSIFIFPFIKRFIEIKPKVHINLCARLPWWFYLGLGIMFTFWLIAWGAIKGLDWIRPYYFFPLWTGFILVINGLAFSLKGSCLMTRSPKGFFCLFPLSAIFWWYFEFLNRFVHNWHYLGVEDYTGFEYAALATLSFSTVLPAVVSVFELLWNLVNFKGAFGNFYSVKIRYPRMMAVAFLIVSCCTMFFLGLFPTILFPLIWVSPLAIFTSVHALLGIETIFSPLSKGDFSKVVAFGLSGLVCGFFWEMWNYYSYPKWVYMIPYVGQFKIFEMPLLGYAGYLPFGLECWVVSRIVVDL